MVTEINKSDFKIGAMLGAFLTIIVPILIFLAMIIHGFVLFKLWNWLIVPIFAVQKLSLVQGIALRYFVSSLTGIDIYEKKTKPAKTIFMAMVLNILLTLFIGWVLSIYV